MLLYILLFYLVSAYRRSALNNKQNQHKNLQQHETNAENDGENPSTQIKISGAHSEDGEDMES